jgi:outer membrane cobalamin receptor
VALLAAALATAPADAAAQEPRDTLPPDSVAYILEPIQVAVERERSAPPPVGALTVDPARLRAAQSPDAYHLVRDVAGVEIHDQGQGPGYASNVVMRGFTSDHSSDVLLVIDGVPVNLPAHGHVEGFADWNVLMAPAVSSLRVLHGNASPLYGDFALAGAVEVFTRADADGMEAMLGGTSFGDVRGSLLTGRRGEDGGFLVGAQGRRDQGWRAGGDHWLANGLLRGWRSVAGGRLEGGLALYGTEWSSPGFLSVPRFNEERFQEPMDESDGGRSRRAVLHGRFARAFSGGRSFQAVAWAMASDYGLFLHVPGHVHGAGDGFLQQSGEWDERLGAGGQVEVGWDTGSGDLVLGASARADDVGYEHALTLGRERVNPEILLDARHASAAMYGRWRLALGDRLGVDLGARLDWLRHESRSELAEAPEWSSATNVVVSPKLGAKYRLGGPWSLQASSARGFRSPVGIIGDPSREPYLAWSHEVGVARAGDGWEAEVAAFRVDVENERVFDPITQRSTGAGESTRQGVEGHLGLRLPRGARLELGGTWNHARLSAPYVDAHDDHPHEVFDGPAVPADTVALSADEANRVPGLADYRAHVRLAAPVGRRAEARLGWRVAGPHTPIGEPTVRTRTYSVLDLGTTVELAPGRVVDVELSNALGVRYVELRSTGYVTPGMPRALRIQLRWAPPAF